MTLAISFKSVRQFNRILQVGIAIGVVVITGVAKAMAETPDGTSLAEPNFDLLTSQFEIIDGHELDLFLGIGLDDFGSVAYTAISVDDDTSDLTGSALLIDRSVAVATGDTITDGVLGFIGQPALAGDGTLAYSADVFPMGAGLSNTGAVVGNTSDPGSHVLRAGRGTNVEGVILEGALNPAINDHGELAYTGVFFNSILGIDASAIVHNDTIVATTGNTVGDYVVDITDGAAINNRGDLAFEASLIDTNTFDPATAIFVNGVLVSISGALTDGLVLTEVFAPSINQQGDLAYVGKFTDSDSGLDSTAIILNGQAVIVSGDTTDQGQVIDLIQDVAINASGQLAFLATFIDTDTGVFFDQGIFLTEKVPEPMSLGILVGFATTVLIKRPRSRRMTLGVS